jgi:uncharacterized protein DUF4232
MRTPTFRLLSTAATLAVATGGTLAFAPASTASTASTPACGNTDLTASYRHSDDGAGHRFGWIVLTNTSGHACHTGGYGGVSYVGHGDGTQIGASAVRRHPSAVKTFVVKPGGRLRSPLDEVRADNFTAKTCRRSHVDGFRVYVPNATKAQFVRHVTTGCRNARVHLLFQKPYRRP